MSQNNKYQAQANKPASAKSEDKVNVRSLKTCFIGQIRFPGEVFMAKKEDVSDESGKLLSHFESVETGAKSKRIEDPKITENPYGVPPALRGQDKES